MTNQKSDSLLLNALQSQSPHSYYLVKYSFDSMGEFILTFITPENKYGGYGFGWEVSESV